jgi:anti-sigma factor ChrR (cupin superfamily)
VDGRDKPGHDETANRTVRPGRAVYSFTRMNDRLRSTLATIAEEAMNKPVPVNPPELRSTLVAASSMPWQRTEFDGIEMKILYQDTEGRSTILFKMAPGAVVPLHEHTALEQTYMLEGSLEDAEGRCGAGDFVWRPGGNIHVAHAPHGAMFLSVFNRPNRFFDGTKFFTAAKEGR